MLGAVQFEGLESIGATIKGAIESLNLTGTTTISIVAGGRRGGAENAKIANAQARPRNGRWKRDPFYLSARTKERLRFLARGMTSTDSGLRTRTAEDMGQVMLEGVKENAAGQRNPDGAPFTKLTANYAAYKRRKFGFTSPVLKATGDLLDGLQVKVDRGG